MKVIEHIESAKRTLFSFEILPPLKGESIDSIFNGIDPLLDFEPAYINVTYHREEYVYKKFDNGLLKRTSVRKRPGTVGICAAILNKYKIDTVPHLICGGFNKEETENALIDLSFLGINNVLALRGDPVKNEPHFVPHVDGHKYAIELVDQIVNLNNGVYLHEEAKHDLKTDFCLGVAGYPEKHFEAMNLNTDLHYLKQKVAAGAEYIVTQMFYDNQKYFEFVKRCREIGIEVPIIPGIKPVTSLRHISYIPKFFHIDFPDELSENLLGCKSNADVRAVGIDWATRQTKELIENNVPCIHFYTMGKSGAVKEVATAAF